MPRLKSRVRIPFPAPNKHHDPGSHAQPGFLFLRLPIPCPLAFLGRIGPPETEQPLLHPTASRSPAPPLFIVCLPVFLARVHLLQKPVGAKVEPRQWKWSSFRFSEVAKGAEELKEIPRSLRFLFRPTLQDLLCENQADNRKQRNEVITKAVQVHGIRKRQLLFIWNCITARSAGSWLRARKGQEARPAPQDPSHCWYSA